MDRRVASKDFGETDFVSAAIAGESAVTEV